jgi:hypothetical protein
LPGGSTCSNPASRLTTELGHSKQFLHLRLYHQGLARMTQEKIVDGPTELVYFGIHSIDHLLWRRIPEHMI